MTTVAHIVARNVNPTFKHDCCRCVFLGKLDGKDLYFCPGEESVVIRNGSNEPQYCSLYVGIVDQLPNGSPYKLGATLWAKVKDGTLSGCHKYVTKHV